jgi:hypothetical protein
MPPLEICRPGPGPLWPVRKYGPGYTCTFSLTSAVDGVGGKRHTLVALHRERDPVRMIYEAGWTTVPVWTGAEKIECNWIRAPDRPVRSQSL